MRCNKCGKKTKPIDGRVTVQVGDTSFSTITEVGHCVFCNIQTVQFQCKIEPLISTIQSQQIQKEEKEYCA